MTVRDGGRFPNHLKRVARGELKLIDDLWYNAEEMAQAFEHLSRDTLIERGAQINMPEHIIPTTKICKQCLIKRPLADFYSQPSNRDGRKKKCRYCSSEASKARHQAQYEHRRERTWFDAEPWREKTCRKCLIKKPSTKFHKTAASSDGLRTQCKDCVKATPKKDARSTYSRYHASEKGQMSMMKGRLRREFGLSLEEYDAMIAQQHGQCAICFEYFSAFSKRPSVDHCHYSGRIRGLLCSQCNVALGLLKENPRIVQSALDYLLKHKT